MVYVIKGTVIREDRPERYMDRFIDFELKREFRGSTTIESRKYLSTTSERVAHQLNKQGHNLQWNEDLERAIEMCDRMILSVSVSKLFKPGEGWGTYLTGRFGDTEEEKTVDGELELWSELRLPSPWLYVAAWGKLTDNFVFDGRSFIVEPNAVHKGSSFTKGLVLDMPNLYLGRKHTSTKVNSTRYSYR